MSDYLWDKSGDGDPEVERLEELLEGLRYQPRELELPQTEAPVARSSQRRYWPLAVAASLLLFGLAGLLLGQQIIRETSQTPEMAAVALTPEMHQRAVAGSPNPGPETFEPVKDNKGQAQNSSDESRRQTPRFERGAKRVGPRRTETELNLVASPGQELASTRTERQLDQQAEEGVRAKEELMLALQVASAKLNHAQRKTHAPVTAPLTGPSQDAKPGAPASSNPWNKSR